MSCCGSKRAALPPMGAPRRVTFEYRGGVALTAIGAATRSLYWFNGPGSRVDVHVRDAESLDSVPALMRVASTLDRTGG